MFEKIIADYDALYPNQIPFEQKQAWLMRFEGQLKDKLLTVYAVTPAPEYIAAEPYQVLSSRHFLHIAPALRRALNCDRLKSKFCFSKSYKLAQFSWLVVDFYIGNVQARKHFAVCVFFQLLYRHTRRRYISSWV